MFGKLLQRFELYYLYVPSCIATVARALSALVFIASYHICPVVKLYLNFLALNEICLHFLL